MSSNQTLIVIAWDKELEGVLEATGAKEHWKHISGRQGIYYSDRIIIALTGASSHCSAAAIWLSTAVSPPFRPALILFLLCNCSLQGCWNTMQWHWQLRRWRTIQTSEP